MPTSNITNRRNILTGVAAIAAVPLTVAASVNTASAATATPISRLWASAEHLTKALSATAANIAMDADSIPLWMRMTGDVNIMGEKRYTNLIGIFNSEAKSSSDLVIMARALMADDIQNGPKSWAGKRLAEATVLYHSAAA